MSLRPFMALGPMLSERITFARAACIRAAMLGVLAGLTAIAHAGPVSPLYLTTGSQMYVIGGSGVIDTWTLPGEQEYAIAVDATVRTYSQGMPLLSLDGHEYQLDGTPTGAAYPNTAGCCFRDGTTDGTFNYAMRLGPGVAGMYRFNLDWTDPQLLLGPNRVGNSTGVAYDSSDDTFWLAFSGTGSVGVMNITRAGDQLYLFSAGPGTGNVSLAYDPADDTLWLHVPTPGASELLQFSTAHTPGVHPPLMTLPGFGFAPGLEFALQREPPTPATEPASAVLLCIALAGVAGLRRARYSRRSEPLRVLKYSSGRGDDAP